VILVARQSSDFHSFTSVDYEYLALRYCAVTRAMVKLIVLYGCEINDANGEPIFWDATPDSQLLLTKNLSYIDSIIKRRPRINAAFD